MLVEEVARTRQITCDSVESVTFSRIEGNTCGVLEFLRVTYSTSSMIPHSTCKVRARRQGFQFSLLAPRGGRYPKPTAQTHCDIGP